MIDSFTVAMPYIVGTGIFILLMNWLESKKML